MERVQRYKLTKTLSIVIMVLMVVWGGCSNLKLKQSQEMAEQDANRLDSLMSEPQWEREPEVRYPMEPKIWDLTHQKIWLDLEFEHQTLDGTTEMLFHSLRDHNDSLIIHADTAYISIDSLELIKSGSRSIQRLDTVSNGYAILLNQPLTTSDSLIIRMNFQVKPNSSIAWVDPLDDDVLAIPQFWADARWANATNWLPTQYRADERMQVEFWITAPSSMNTVATGTLLEQQGSEDEQTMESYWRAESVAPYQMMVTVGDFYSWPHRRGARLWEGYTTVKSNPWQDMYDPVKSVQGQMSSPVIQIVPWQEWYGNAAGTGNALILTPNSQYDKRAAKEISNDDVIWESWFKHQYSSVPTTTWADVAFLDGVSRYLMLQQKKADDQHVTRDLWRKQYFAEAQRFRRPLITDRYSEVSNWDDAHTRFKWPLLLAQLESQYGKEPILNALRSLRENAKPDDSPYELFVERLERTLGVNLADDLRTWGEQRGHPSVTVTVDTTQAEVLLKVRQLQDPERQPIFHLAIPYELITSEGTKRGLARMTNPDSTFTVDKEGAFYDLIIDPQGTMLADLNMRRLNRSQLMDRLQHSSVTVKLRTLDYLWEHPNSRDGLEDVLLNLSENKSDHWMVRQKALRIASVTISKPPSDLLAKWSYPDEPEGRVRMQALLWATRDSSDSSYNAIKEFIDDPSYFVEAEAIKSLCRYYPEHVDDQIYSYVDSTSYRSVLRQALAQGMRYVHDEKASEVLEELISHQTESGYRVTAMRVLVYKYNQGMYEHSKFIEHVKKWLHSPFITIRKEGYDIISTLGLTGLTADLYESMKKRSGAEKTYIQNIINGMGQAEEQQ